MEPPQASATSATFFACDSDGATTDLVGFGTLVGEVLVLVHPPLGDQLRTADSPPRLRVGLCAPDAGSSVQVVDVVGIHVAAGDSIEGVRQPRSSLAATHLVFAELARPVKTATLPMPGAARRDRDGAAVRSALSSYLSSLAEEPIVTVEDAGGVHAMGIFCWLNPKWCIRPAI